MLRQKTILLRLFTRLSVWHAPKELRSLELKSSEQVRVALGARYQFSHVFAELLLASAKRNKNGALGRVLHRNWTEETGQTGALPHSVGRQWLLERLKFDYEVWSQELNPAAQRVIQFFRQAIEYPHPLYGGAALSLHETVVPQQYRLLVAALRQRFWGLDEHDMEHLLDHIKHDEGHGKAALSALACDVKGVGDFIAAARGIFAAKRAWTRFWKEVICEKDLPP